MDDGRLMKAREEMAAGKRAQTMVENAGYGEHGDCMTTGNAGAGPSREYPSREYIVDQLFTYHRPDPTQQASLETIREAAKFLAKLIMKLTPPGADQTAAIRKLREAVMTANAAIVLNGLSL